ncbi:hypothetical protein D3C75_1279370 [compost metagenome]
MKPRIASEILGDQRRATDLAGGIDDQAAIGLGGKGDLRHAGDHQRVRNTGDQGHQE